MIKTETNKNSKMAVSFVSSVAHRANHKNN